MDAHDLVSALKELAIEFGRTPTKDEFISRGAGREFTIRKNFAGYTSLVQAAGLEPNKHVPMKIDNAIFDRDLRSHLENYKPKNPSNPQEYPRIASISDAHFPFENPRVFDAFYRFIEEFHPDYVIFNGDAVDFYSFSRFPRSHNVFTPREEVALARQKNEAFWNEVSRLVPSASRYQLLGNHEVRPLRQVLENYPVAEDWIQEAMRKQFTFEGVKTILDPTQELMLPGDIMVHHGYQSGLGKHRDYALYNAVVGHTHLGGVTYRRIRGQTLWELNSGYAADPNSKGLSYRSQKITHWTPGFAVIDAHGPRFIPID